MIKEPIDVLVLGTGISGCSVALAAADAGARVTMITRAADPALTSTAWAQGGIIYKGIEDSPAILERDILEAGAGACSPKAVRQLCELGPELVRQVLIERLGVEFDGDGAGGLDLTEEAAHSMPRIVHVQDLTGRAVEQRFLECVMHHPRIELLTDATAIDLLTLSHHSRRPADVYKKPACVGAYVLHQQEGQVHTHPARHTVLATGGLGQIFLHTTNPPGSRGDGIAMAYRAGVRLVNLEYVQFHPTVLYHQGSGGFLLSESLRGEGARLVLPDGGEFMHKYDERGSLAPRDIVARAIHEEMLLNGYPCVYLDISHREAQWVRRRFPNIYAKCLSLGLDLTHGPIPVVPAAHYACGGVAVDLCGRTNLRRLWAVGETSCTGVHGANRLASTSLLEGLVWGTRCGTEIFKELEAPGNSYFPAVDEWRYERFSVDPALLNQDWTTIKQTMWNYVGLVRNRRRLKRAYRILRELQNEIEEFYARTQVSDEMVGLRNGCLTALATLHAAKENHQSRGTHYRED